MTIKNCPEVQCEVDPMVPSHMDGSEGGNDEGESAEESDGENEGDSDDSTSVLVTSLGHILTHQTLYSRLDFLRLSPSPPYKFGLRALTDISSFCISHHPYSFCIVYITYYMFEDVYI